jgi:hypothetical protein
MTMPELPQKPPLATMEADLFGVIFEFHRKVMILLRESLLDDEKLKVVADRIKTLLDPATAELMRTQQLNMKERLKAAYDEVKRLVEELSGSPDRGKDG